MFKLIKELLNLNKAIGDKSQQIFHLDKAIENKQKVIDQIRNNADMQAQQEAREIISRAKSELQRIESEIARKDEYIKQVEEIKAEYDKISSKVSKENNKLTKIKSIYERIQYITEKYKGMDIFNENIDSLVLKDQESNDEIALEPTVQLKFHSMDLKELRKAFSENEKLIKETLERYEGRYTTKANAALYKLMVIALKAEQQNILYNLKYEKLEKSIEDVKKTTGKYLSIVGDGNKSILNTATKFINEIEYLFIKSIEIEYQYYIKKEQEKAEQAMLREQMRQEAEERKILEQQQKQVEKEEEKYKNEIAKVEEMLALAENDEKLKQLQDRINELQSQLNLVEQKKEDIISRQNGKAGYVYIISNLGSFGDKVFKIGMTRRLDPQDRVDELGDASVPFSFDVHSFIFSDDAVSLEQKLHNTLTDVRVNKVNLKKEFFNISVEELQKLVEEIDPSAEFNMTMMAEQYRQTLTINEDKLMLI
jgi:hypothetical protein